MTETTYASNMDDLVAQIGELDHELDKLTHKAAPGLENTICRLITKVLTQAGEIEALKWTIKTLTERQK